MKQRWHEIIRRIGEQKHEEFAASEQKASLSQAMPDVSFKELRKIYADKEMRVQVPERVFNAARRHLEKI